MGKFDKKSVCEYCENEMQSAYRNKRFCSNKCRVYFNRERHKLELEDNISQENIQAEDNFKDINKEKRENILALIESIRNTPIPKERDTPNGKKYWEIETKQKIKILEEKLKSLN